MKSSRELIATICLFVSLLVSNSPCTHAKSGTFRIISGEGNQPGALLFLDNASGMFLGVYCTKNAQTGIMSLALHIDFESRVNLPKPLSQLTRIEEIRMPICLNSAEFCYWKDWEASDEGSDETGHGMQLADSFELGLTNKEISSIGVMIAPIRSPYMFVGDARSILDRICVSDPPELYAPRDEQPTRWNHNGSIMKLVVEGNRCQFLYEVPRQGMRDVGAEKGSLLFDGVATGGRYSGTAYIFNERCGQYPYEVSGPTLDGGSRVVMRGLAPRIDGRCKVFGYKEDVLEFTLVPWE